MANDAGLLPQVGLHDRVGKLLSVGNQLYLARDSTCLTFRFLILGRYLYNSGLCSVCICIFWRSEMQRTYCSKHELAEGR